MLCVPGRCIKCPCRIVSGTSVGDKYQELVCSTQEVIGKDDKGQPILDTKGTVTVGVCRECEISDADIPELNRAVIESFRSNGFNPKFEITGIVRRKTLSNVLSEVQASRCVNCDESLGMEWALSNGRAIHVLCESQKPNTNETPRGKEKELKPGKKIIRKGRRKGADVIRELKVEQAVQQAKAGFRG